MLEAFLETIKVFCLFFSIMFVTLNAMKGMRGHPIPRNNFIFMSVAMTGFIYLQWLR